jgi:hypothetical protein
MTEMLAAAGEQRVRFARTAAEPGVGSGAYAAPAVEKANEVCVGRFAAGPIRAIGS